MKIILQIIFVMVFFEWEPNVEPDMSHYILYQRIGVEETILNNHIPHPTATVGVDIPVNDLAEGWYYLKAVDTEGFKSDRSNEVNCDQPCIDKYLSGNPTGTTELRVKDYQQ